MKRFLLAGPVCVMLATTLPASAQVYPDAGLNRLDDPNYYAPSRLDDPNYGFPQSHWRRGYYAGSSCRVISERIVLPDGREIYRSREICG